jgi:Ankyrin repeats (3 copies)
LVLGRVRFIEEIIRRTGWGINFDSLETELEEAADKQAHSSAKIEAPQFYSGIRVRGKFRRDWARATAPPKESSYHSATVPIALQAAYFGNSDSIKWIFGDGPEKAMDDFMSTHKSDKRSRMLEKLDWRKRLPEWLGTKFLSVTNALHAAIMSNEPTAVDTVFALFIEQNVSPLKMLDSVATKNSPVRNCLLVATQYHDCFVNVLEKYLEHKGDPTIRDDLGNNVLHLLASHGNIQHMEYFVSRISVEARDSMLCARVSPGLFTPMHLAILGRFIKTVKVLLEYGTQQLQIRDGDGNLPIHLAVSRSLKNKTELLVAADPNTLQIEDAAGTLPVEIAQQRFIMYRSQTHPLEGFAFVGTGLQRFTLYREGIYPSYNSIGLGEGSDPKVKQMVETADISAFLEEQEAMIDQEKPIACMEVVRRAMAELSLSKRQLVPLSEVADVVNRATKSLTPATRSAGYGSGDPRSWEEELCT